MTLATSANRILTTISLLICTAGLVAGQSKPPCVVESEKSIFEAENLDDYGKLSSAKADECVRLNAKSVEALIVRARILAYMNQFDAALADADKAVALAPNSSDAAFARGFVLDRRYRREFDKRFGQEAVAAYDQALKLNPQNGLALLAKTVLARYNMGSNFRSLLPQFDLAIKNLTASGQTWEAARGYYERGNAKTLDALWDDGIKDFTTSLNLRPNYLAPLMLRATANATRTDAPNLDAAIADYTAYLKVKKAPYVLGLRADLYERKRDFANAAADYRAMLALDPGDEFAKERLAKLGPATATPGAGATQMTAEQFAANGRRLAAQKDYYGAIDSFSQCLVLKANATACLAFRGYALAKTGDLPAALEDFNEALKLEPKQPATYFVRGMMWTEVGDKPKAISDFRMVLQLEPNHAPAKAALQKLGIQL